MIRLCHDDGRGDGDVAFPDGGGGGGGGVDEVSVPPPHPPLHLYNKKSVVVKSGKILGAVNGIILLTCWHKRPMCTVQR